MNTLREIAERLKKLKSAVIFTHMRPDGDTIGSALALSRALTLSGVKNEVVNEGAIPEKFFFLEGVSQIKSNPTLNAEAYIAVDTSEPARLGALQTVYSEGARKKPTFNLDHHVSNTRYANYNFVRDRASNCENIAELISLLGIKGDKQIAEALFMGMVTDSGGFSHSDVNGDTFRAAAECLDAGADLKKITYEVFEKQTQNRAKFYLAALSNLRFLLDGRFAAVVVSQEQLAKYSLPYDATEGLVDFALTIDTVEISASLLEMKKGQYKVSLRSKGIANVNEMARIFGGGGHVLASGCMLFGETEEVLDKLRYAAVQQLG